MELSIETLGQLPTPMIRQGLAPWVASHLHANPEAREALQLELQTLLDAATDAEIVQLLKAFREAGEGWRLFPADPLAQRLTRTYMAALTTPWSVAGGEHLDAFLQSPARRRLVVCNHLSYTDTQVTDVVLALDGRADFANRLVAVAGPKVYTEAWRRMASIALNTRKTAQSSAVASEQDSLSPRELATIALEALADCVRLMDEGYIILLYPEGTRSREGRLGPFLRAASRYLSVEGLEVLPLGQVGGDALFPIDAKGMFRGPVSLTFGPSFRPADYPGKTGALAEAHRRVAEVLPESKQPIGPDRVT